MDKPVTFQKFTGLNSLEEPERLKPEDLTEALNVDVSGEGQISRRIGYALARAGNSHSLWSSGPLAFFASGATLFRLNADYSATALRSITPNLPVSYYELNNRVYWTTGAESGIYDDGVMRSWGLVPPALPGATAIGGLLPEGAYLFTLTYIRRDGQESGAPVSGRIDLPDGSGIRFALPASADPDVVGAVVYISQPNGDVLYRALYVLAGTATADFTGSEVSLVTPLDRMHLREAPVGQIVSHFNGRMLVAGGGYLGFSQPYGYELFDPRDYIPIDTSGITIVAPVTDGIFVGTRERVVFLMGSGPEDFRVVTKAPCGALPGTLVYVDPDGVKFEGLQSKVIAIFTTERGIVAAADGGVLFDMTQDKHEIAAYQRGAALYRNTGGEQRYVAVLQT